MEETGEGLPNFSIGIDLLGPDPISNKNKSKKLANCTFRKFVSRPAAANLTEGHSLGTKKGHQLVIINI